MNTPGVNVRTLVTGPLGPFLALLLVFVCFALADEAQPGGGQFSSLRNLQTMLVSSAPVVVGALGMTVIIIAGGIDLSAGTALALSATVMAWVLKHGGPIELALICCVLTGCTAGAVNGVMVSA